MLYLGPSSFRGAMGGFAPGANDMAQQFGGQPGYGSMLQPSWLQGPVTSGGWDVGNAPPPLGRVAQAGQLGPANFQRSWLQGPVTSGGWQTGGVPASQAGLAAQAAQATPRTAMGGNDPRNARRMMRGDPRALLGNLRDIRRGLKEQGVKRRDLAGLNQQIRSLRDMKQAMPQGYMSRGGPYLGGRYMGQRFRSYNPLAGLMGNMLMSRAQQMPSWLAQQQTPNQFQRQMQGLRQIVAPPPQQAQQGRQAGSEGGGFNADAARAMIEQALQRYDSSGRPPGVDGQTWARRQRLGQG